MGPVHLDPCLVAHDRTTHPPTEEKVGPGEVNLGALGREHSLSTFLLLLLLLHRFPELHLIQLHSSSSSGAMESQTWKLLLSLSLLPSFLLVPGARGWTGEIRGRVVCDVCGDSSIGPEDHVLQGLSLSLSRARPLMSELLLCIGKLNPHDLCARRA